MVSSHWFSHNTRHKCIGSTGSLVQLFIEQLGGVKKTPSLNSNICKMQSIQMKKFQNVSFKELK